MINITVIDINYPVTDTYTFMRDYNTLHITSCFIVGIAQSTLRRDLSMERVGRFYSTPCQISLLNFSKWLHDMLLYPSCLYFDVTLCVYTAVHITKATTINQYQWDIQTGIFVTRQDVHTMFNTCCLWWSIKYKHPYLIQSPWMALLMIANNVWLCFVMITEVR